MSVSLETLEEFLTDDRDDLDNPLWLGSASAQSYAACYVAARQGPIEVADLLWISIGCDHLTPFLIRRVLTAADVSAAQEVIERLSYRHLTTSSERSAFFMLKSWIARKTFRSQS